MEAVPIAAQRSTPLERLFDMRNTSFTHLAVERTEIQHEGVGWRREIVVNLEMHFRGQRLQIRQLCYGICAPGELHGLDARTEELGGDCRSGLFAKTACRNINHGAFGPWKPLRAPRLKERASIGESEIPCLTVRSGHLRKNHGP